MLAWGQIQPSRSPTSTLILFVPKKGRKLRLCVNYKALNQITKKNRAPLLLIEEILDQLLKVKVYTKLDLKDIYYQVHIKPGNKQKTAFCYRYSHFEYYVIPFSLVNILVTFQTFINKALGDLVNTIYIVYLNNILIYSKSKEEYIQYVYCVLKRLQ